LDSEAAFNRNRTTAYILRGGVYLSGALIIAGLALRSDPLIRAGIFSLIAAPLVNVCFLGFFYAARSKWRWTAAAALILATIALSAYLGISH
jgi:uncharacterized membrane protein